MDIAVFQEVLKAMRLPFKEEDGKLIIDFKGNISISDYHNVKTNKYERIEQIPENIVFRTTGLINAYVNIPHVKKIHDSVVFENTGDVYMHQQVELPKGFKGFKNKGNIHPENFKFKKPVPYYYLSTFFYGFLSECTINNATKSTANHIINNFNGRPVDPEILNATYIDCENDKSEMVTYISADKVFRYYTAYLKDFNEKNEGKKAIPVNFHQWTQNNISMLYDSKDRSRIKIGRFLKKVIPNVMDTQIEEFVNKYKSMKTIDDYEFVIMRGDEIHKCYDRAHQDCPTSSSLYNSCRNYSSEKDPKFAESNLYKYCNFYASTPETCGLLVLKYKGEEKIRGRAFIWNTTDGKTYVDRVYCASAAENNIYADYIKKNGYVTGPKKGIQIKVNEACRTLVPQLPYLDSFQYDKTKDILI